MTEDTYSNYVRDDARWSMCYSYEDSAFLSARMRNYEHPRITRKCEWCGTIHVIEGKCGTCGGPITRKLNPF